MPRLRLTRLGRDGPPVSALGLGLAALGRPGYLNLDHDRDLPDHSVERMRAHAHDVLEAAYASGCRYVDAARSYGLAEDFLADWLPRAADVTVGSKWGYTYTAGWQVDADVHEVKDHSLASLDRQYAESRALLGGRLQLYQVHSATRESGVLGDRAVLERLAALRADGLLVGLTTSGPEQSTTIRDALCAEVDGVPVFGCVQATWNLLEPSAGGALAEAHDAGWGVIVKEAVANGRLTERGPAPPALTAAAAELGVRPDAVALAGVLQQPFVDVVLSGAATAAQWASNRAAVDLPAVDVDVAPEPPEAYWQQRTALRWS